MGTRGAYGYRVDGVDKLAYNHFDSYPSALGCDVAEYIRRHSVEEMKDAARKVVLVQQGDTPTQEQLNEVSPILGFDEMIGYRDDWYSLLRNAQGDLEVYHNGLQYMGDATHFPKDSLFCEWAYVINLDEEILEVYMGFQHDENPGGRYQPDTPYRSPSGEEYWGVKLIRSISLGEVDPDEVARITGEEG